jgi:hypothetical protein
MKTYGELRTLIRTLQANDAPFALDEDFLPDPLPNDEPYVLILYSRNYAQRGS